MGTSSKGMVQVSGTTYRLVERGPLHEVVRVLDDRLVGSFRHVPAREILHYEIQPEILRDVAFQALRMARLSWSRRCPSRPGASSWLEWALAGLDRILAAIVKLGTPSERMQSLPALAASSSDIAHGVLRSSPRATFLP